MPSRDRFMYKILRLCGAKYICLKLIMTQLEDFIVTF